MNAAAQLKFYSNKRDKVDMHTFNFHYAIVNNRAKEKCYTPTQLCWGLPPYTFFLVLFVAFLIMIKKKRCCRQYHCFCVLDIIKSVTVALRPKTSLYG